MTTMMIEPRPCTAPIDRSAAWHHTAQILRDHPGDWHEVRVCPSSVTARSTARDIRDGVIVAFRPAGTYQAAADGHTVKAVYHPTEGTT